MTGLDVSVQEYNASLSDVNTKRKLVNSDNGKGEVRWLPIRTRGAIPHACALRFPPTGAEP
jgi:hypothetical protein